MLFSYFVGHKWLNLASKMVQTSIKIPSILAKCLPIIFQLSFNYINEWYSNKDLNMIQNDYMTSESAKQEGIETQKSLM